MKGVIISILVFFVLLGLVGGVNAEQKLYGATYQNGKIFAFDGNTWSLSYDSLPSIRSLEVFNGKLYAGTDNYKIYAYNGESWELAYDFEDVRINGWRVFNIISLETYNGTLYAGANSGFILALNGTDWKLSHITSPRYDVLSLKEYDGKLYAGGKNNIYVFDGNSWSTSFNKWNVNIWSMGTYDSKLYAGFGAGGCYGCIYQFDGNSWSLSYDSNSIEIHSFGEFGNSLYAGGSEGLYRRQGGSWSKVRTINLAAYPIYSLVSYDDKLFAGTQWGRVYSSSDGVRWSTSLETGQRKVWAMEIYPQFTPPPVPTTEDDCTNNLDDDEDGLVDYNDPDCSRQIIEDYFPHYYLSGGERYKPASFYFDNNADVSNNQENYDSRVGAWDSPYVYVNLVDNGAHFTIQYWPYYANNPWGWPLLNHEHDWESVHVVFAKNDLSKPVEVRYAHHNSVTPVPWDNVERTGNHSKVFVAEGSHASYPNIDAIPAYDFITWNGIQIISPDDVNWILVNEGPHDESVQYGNTFCSLDFETIMGVSQPEPIGGQWPKYYPGEDGLVWHFMGRPGSYVAPWHRGSWTMTHPNPPGLADIRELLRNTFMLGVIGPADLHIYDSSGRHVGINYNTGELETQIPNAVLYSDAEGQLIEIPGDIENSYVIKIVGTGDGEYDFAAFNTTEGDFVFWEEHLNTPIVQGKVHAYSMPIKTPYQFKSSSVTKLEDAKAGNKKIDGEIDKIIEHIQKSLTDKKEEGSLWLDDWHISVKDGKKVFHEERTAVELMQKEIKKKETPAEIKAIFEEVINDLLNADEVVARTIIDDAKNTQVLDPDNQKKVDEEIEMAEEEFENALEEISKERPDKAIKNFENAWGHAQDAIKYAQENEKAVEKKIDELEKSLTQLGELNSVLGEAVIVDYTAQSLNQLRSTIVALNLDKNVENSLLAKVDEAIKKTGEAGYFVQNGDESQAWNMLSGIENVLEALNNEVEAQRGKKISQEDADILITQSQQAVEGIEGGSLNLLAHLEDFNVTLSSGIIGGIEEKVEETQLIISELEALGAEVSVAMEEPNPEVGVITVNYGLNSIPIILDTAQTAAIETYALVSVIAEKRGEELNLIEKIYLYRIDIQYAEAYKFSIPGITEVIERLLVHALKTSIEEPEIEPLKDVKFAVLTSSLEGYSEIQQTTPKTPKVPLNYLTPENGEVLEEVIESIFVPEVEEFLWYIEAQHRRIYKLDPSTGEVIDYIPMPYQNTQGLTWDGEYLWTSISYPQRISKLDPSTGEVIESLPTPGWQPRGLAWDGTYFWHVDISWDIPSNGYGRIYKLDPSDGTVISSFPAPGDRPYTLAWDGEYLWSADSGEHVIHKLDPSDGTVVHSIPSPRYPYGLTWDGVYLWVTGASAERIYKVDPSDGTVISSFPALGWTPRDVAWQSNN
jgi:hypothetical protein